MAWSKRSKYGAEKTVIDGRKFDSRKEARRYQELRLLERAGEISHLECQVKFELIPSQKYQDAPTRRQKTLRGVSYVADFVYMDKYGNTIVEDVKGFRTDAYRIKRKLMLQRFGILIKEV